MPESIVDTEATGVVAQPCVASREKGKDQGFTSHSTGDNSQGLACSFLEEQGPSGVWSAAALSPSCSSDALRYAIIPRRIDFGVHLHHTYCPFGIFVRILFGMHMNYVQKCLMFSVLTTCKFIIKINGMFG